MVLQLQSVSKGDSASVRLVNGGDGHHEFSAIARKQVFKLEKAHTKASVQRVILQLNNN